MKVKHAMMCLGSWKTLEIYRNALAKPPSADTLANLLLMTLSRRIIWVWHSAVTLEAKFTLAENVFPASCQIIAESHPRIWGEGIACSWNVLRVGIFSDSIWCITAVVFNYIVCCMRKKNILWMWAVLGVYVLYAVSKVMMVCFELALYNKIVLYS